MRLPLGRGSKDSCSPFPGLSQYSDHLKPHFVDFGKRCHDRPLLEMRSRIFKKKKARTELDGSLKNIFFFSYFFMYLKFSEITREFFYSPKRFILDCFDDYDPRLFYHFCFAARFRLWHFHLIEQF